jgi:hypothetical protein
MQLYHWTLSDRAELILRDGFLETQYAATDDGRRGVWFCEDDYRWYKRGGNDARVAVDVPEDELDVTWRLPDGNWLLPLDVANRYRIPEIHRALPYRSS